MVERELARGCLELLSRLETTDRCPPEVVAKINLKPKSSSRFRRSGPPNLDAPEFAELRAAYRLKKKVEIFLIDAKKLFGLQEHSVLFPPFSNIFHFAWNHIIWELGTARGIEMHAVFNSQVLSYVFYLSFFLSFSYPCCCRSRCVVMGSLLLFFFFLTLSFSFSSSLPPPQIL